eukprot:406703-Amphidinium_carterae.1
MGDIELQLAQLRAELQQKRFEAHRLRWKLQVRGSCGCTIPAHDSSLTNLYLGLHWDEAWFRGSSPKARGIDPTTVVPEAMTSGSSGSDDTAVMSWWRLLV